MTHDALIILFMGLLFVCFVALCATTIDIELPQLCYGGFDLNKNVEPFNGCFYWR